MEAPSNCSRNGTSIIDESLLSLEIDRERIMNLKQRVDFVEMLSDEISITIDNFRKQSFLSYILAATCPSSENRTEEIRTKELRSIICSSRAEYQAILRQALTKLKRVKNECAIIAKEKENIFLQLSVKKSAEMDIYRLNEYLIIFESIFKSAKENYDKVTSEYLILRHNGRVLQDLLDERFKETEASFLESSQALEQYESEATVKIENTKLMYQYKLETVTRQLRDDVHRLETETHDLAVKVNKDTIQRQKTRKALKQELKFYQYNYNLLQQKRRYELENVRSELSKLKNMIVQVQEQMYSKYRSPGPESVDLASVSFAVPMSKSKIFGMKRISSEDESDLEYQIESIRKVLNKNSMR